MNWLRRLWRQLTCDHVVFAHFEGPILGECALCGKKWRQ